MNLLQVPAPQASHIVQRKLRFHSGDIFRGKCPELPARRKFCGEPVGKRRGKPGFMRIPGEVGESQHGHGTPRTDYAPRAARRCRLQNADCHQNYSSKRNCGHQDIEAPLPRWRLQVCDWETMMVLCVRARFSIPCEKIILELMPRRMLMLRMRLVNRSQETVAVAGNRLHIPRTVRGIPERGPQFGHRFVQAPIEIHERMRRPEFSP